MSYSAFSKLGALTETKTDIRELRYTMDGGALAADTILSHEMFRTSRTIIASHVNGRQVRCFHIWLAC